MVGAVIDKPRVRPGDESGPAIEFELALQALSMAVDGMGRAIQLMAAVDAGSRPSASQAPSADEFHKRVTEHLNFMHGSQYAGPLARLAFARNLALLSYAWACAINYEQELNKK